MKLRFGIFAGIFMAFLSLYPQFYFQYQRGENYNGAAFYYDYDEPNYAAYLQALIDGRPRKNSIYQGGDEPQQDETFYSIQFIPAYLAAIPARIFGFSSETAFLFISVVCAFLSGLIIYFLLQQTTENPYLAMTGTFFVLICGANLAGISILKETLGFGPSAFYLTFLRRYTPAIGFPFIFLFLVSVWRGLKTVEIREKYLYALGSVICFGVLIYSYFFFWTAVLAWLLIFSVLNIILFRSSFDWRFWITVFLGIGLSFIPYYFLLSNRHATTDDSQVLEFTRKLVLLRTTIFAGMGLLCLAVFAIKLKLIKLTDQGTILVLSLAALPPVVFNEQIVTGMSLQPMHYNMYILNYLVPVGLIVLVGELLKVRSVKVKPLVWLTIAVLIGLWGVVETNYTTRNRFQYNQMRDEAFPVNRHLAEIGKADPETARTRITLNFDSVQGDNQPTVAPQGVLWSEHLFFAGNMSVEEHQKRYFLYMYFQKRNPSDLRRELDTCPNQTCRALIGWRINPTLSLDSSGVDSVERDAIVQKYSRYIESMSVSEALSPTVSYLIVRKGLNFDLTNFERWYQKEESGRIGEFILYKVKPIAR